MILTLRGVQSLVAPDPRKLHSQGKAVVKELEKPMCMLVPSKTQKLEAEGRERQ